MKKIVLVIFVFYSFLLSAQTIKTDKFELYLNDYDISEVSISKGMYMTKNMQYFYEGSIEVVEIDTNTTKKYRFFFSKWDEKLKEFIVKDMNYQYLTPEFTYLDNATIKFLDKLDIETTKTLKDNSNAEFVILSSMLVWLENNSL